MLSPTGLRHLQIEHASVTVTDRSTGQSTTYKNITLISDLSPHHSGSEGGSHATGTLVAQSEEDAGGDVLKTELPFDLTIGRRNGSALFVKGSVGPGRLETSNVRIGEFSINGDVQAHTGASLEGSGQLSATDLFISTINLSQNVAQALKTNQIGDMSPGTQIASLDTNFQLDKGLVRTTGVRIQQLDGLGDATASQGTFKIEAALIVDYSGTVTLSPDSTARFKSASPMLGIFATILEVNNRLSIPLIVRGDVRSPQITVDVSRIF